jgi:predicted peptidase
MIGWLRGGLVLTGLVVFFLAEAEAGVKTKQGFLDKVYTAPSGEKSKYVVFAPHDYNGDKEYPLILFLHGSGETGTDGEKQVQVGLGPAIKKQEKTFPCLAVFPQSHERTWQADSNDAKNALGILAEVRKDYKVDPKRIYLTGLSMGGYGTWSLAVKHPEQWAAIVPICGGGDPSKAAAIKDIPCWIFHCDADNVVPVRQSRDMKEALEKAGGAPKYDEYAGVGHNSWDRAYATPELYTWLFKQERK